MAQNGTLSTKKRRAIQSLLSASTMREAANAADVGERTLWRWLKDQAFRRALDAATTALIDATVIRMTGDLEKNQAVLRTIRDDPKNSSSVRVRAAGTLDSSFLRWRELRDIERRLTELERFFDEEDSAD